MVFVSLLSWFNVWAVFKDLSSEGVDMEPNIHCDTHLLRSVTQKNTDSKYHLITFVVPVSIFRNIFFDG